MSNSGKLFFTIEAALDAVGRALGQYPLQMNLLAVLWPMIFGQDAYLLAAHSHRSAWVKIPEKKKLVAADEADLKRRIMEHLRRSPPAPERLASIAALVFGVHAEAQSGSAQQGPPGIWIDTDMADFVCTQCGHCCLTLDYREGCTPADVARWQEIGRTDILEWVGTVRQSGRVVACRIWMVPGTNGYADRCPWLTVSPEHGNTVCTIHDVRPTVCRQYPGSRKHARLTGCKGV
jgi:Fe-S-cluster containining protein